jgi:hypothetical protein
MLIQRVAEPLALISPYTAEILAFGDPDSLPPEEKERLKASLIAAGMFASEVREQRTVRS